MGREPTNDQPMHPPPTLCPPHQVTDQKTGVSFSGESPTKPWTDVCIAHRTGQRISGPLFFGFSDLATQRAIAELYSPQELQAALQVGTAWSCSALQWCSKRVHLRELCMGQAAPAAC